MWQVHENCIQINGLGMRGFVTRGMYSVLVKMH